MEASRTKKVAQQGFSILELMVVLFVASILLGVGVPAFTGFMDTNRMSASVNDLSTSLQLARTEAVKRRAVVSVCPSTTWANPAPTCNFAVGFDRGWIVFVDDDTAPFVADLAPNNGDDVLFAHGPLPDRLAVTVADDNAVIGGRQFVAFAQSGYPLQRDANGNDAAFNFQFCDDRGNKDTGGGVAAGRWVQLTPTGRPQIHRQVDEVQSGINPAGGCI